MQARIDPAFAQDPLGVVALNDGCLDEDAILAFVEGRTEAAALDRIHAHLDGCPLCQQTVAAAARAFRAHATAPQAAPVGATFAAGQHVAGRYRIVRFIARGGMGEVYEAEDQVLHERIALKVVAASIADDARASARFKAEVQLARRVTHPNVCRIFDLGVHHGAGEPIPFFTMELLRGESLGVALRERGRLAPAEAWALAAQMASALAAAHRAGVVHRDFKSDNVMLLSGGRVTVMDFGLARGERGDVGAGVTTGAALLGSLGYMAPEQVRGQATTAASDVYAFGVVLFEMLTGRLPFLGSSPLATAVLRLTDDAPAAGLGGRIDALVRRCLERDPGARFASFDEVLRAGQAAFAGAERTRAPDRRVMLALGGLLAIAGLVAAGRPAAEPRPTISASPLPPAGEVGGRPRLPGEGTHGKPAPSRSPALVIERAPATAPVASTPAPPVRRRANVAKAKPPTRLPEAVTSHREALEKRDKTLLRPSF